MQNSWSYIPWWVYPLFIYLLVLGIQQCFPRTIKVWRLFVLPLIFILMSLNHFDGSPQITLLSGACWLATLALGGYFGYWHKRDAQIAIDRKRQIVTIPGDWTMLVLIFSVFVIEFAINAIEATGSSSSPWFAPITLGVSGAITGMALGRNSVYLYRYFYSESMD